MCGIIYASNLKTKSVRDWVLSQYEDQHERGNNGFGIVRIDGEKNISLDRATEPVKFLLDLYKSDAESMLVHHRYPTSSKNRMRQTHPILVRNGSLAHEYLVVHNGVIRNEDALYDEHNDLGFVYTTAEKVKSTYSYAGASYDKLEWNDSEGLAIEVAQFIEGRVTQIGAEGSAAFIALQIDPKTQKLERVFFGRNDSNPLNMAKTRGEICLSSEGKGSLITPFVLYSFVPEGDMKLTRRAMTWKKTEYKPYPATGKGHLHIGSPAEIGFTDKAVPTVFKTTDSEPKSNIERTVERWDEEYAEAHKEMAEEGIAELVQDVQSRVDDLVSEYFDDAVADAYILPDIEDFMKRVRTTVEEGVLEVKTRIQEFEATELHQHAIAGNIDPRTGDL